MAFWAMSHTVWGNVALSKYGVSSVSPGIQITLSHPKQPPPESRDAVTDTSPPPLRYVAPPSNTRAPPQLLCKPPSPSYYRQKPFLLVPTYLAVAYLAVAYLAIVYLAVVYLAVVYLAVVYLAVAYLYLPSTELIAYITARISHQK
jgi:hypothetical protein